MTANNAGAYGGMQNGDSEMVEVRREAQREGCAAGATICITNAGGGRDAPYAADQRGFHPDQTISQSTSRGRFLAVI
ncbi:jg26850 [Pararge aegeria aegeria]|uniref:Jg26850 protein n=1 Tax=Pararge aegeria aegeria TaxID=348720 RepID=A0A8S4SFG0_9NEOP|nr:jg26850 [Pararge aegeria aegeria]